MRFVILQMRGSVEINGTFGLKCIHYGPKGDILDYWRTHSYFGLLSFYGKNESVVSNTVTIAQGVRYFGRSCMYGVE